MSDSCILCLDTWVWSDATKSPYPRVGHAVTYLPAGHGGDPATVKLYVFGGFSGDGFCKDLLAIDASGAAVGTPSTFSQLATKGSPSMRFAHCVAALDGRLFVFGGSAAHDELNDLCEIQLPG